MRFTMSTTTKLAPAKNIEAGTDALVYAVLGIVSIFTGWYLWGGRSLHFQDPIYYNGDALAHLTMIRNLIENHWVYTASRLGAPFGSSSYDYTLPDTGTLAILKMLGHVSRNPGWTYNVYYFAGFALDSMFAYAVLRYLAIRRILAFAGAFAFTMLPFHFMRMGHLFYTWYFSAPIFTWYAVRAYKGDLDFLVRGRVRVQLFDLAALVVLTSLGVYYAFFGALAIAAATLARYLKAGDIKSVRGGAVACLILLTGVAANVSPTIVYQYHHGVNQEVAARVPAESEYYGMKITQLLLPWVGHRSQTLADLSQNYSKTFPLVNENQMASLGFIGSIGFLAMLLSLMRIGDRRGETFPVLAILTLTFVLFCSIGGLSSLFSILVSPKIRAWNRASVFVAFFSIAAAMLLLQQLLRRSKPVIAGAVGIALCVFVIWDQTPSAPMVPVDPWHQLYESDKTFTAGVERLLCPNCAVYQIPYVAYPEVPPVNELGAYDQLVGYLNSKTLRWSFGGIKGREGDLFFRQLATEPLAKQIQAAREKGFSGIWVARRGYDDHGAKVEAELARILGKPPALVSPNGDLSFFVLEPLTK